MEESVISQNHLSTLKDPQFIKQKVDLDCSTFGLVHCFFNWIRTEEKIKYRIIHDLSFPKEGV